MKRKQITKLFAVMAMAASPAAADPAAAADPWAASSTASPLGANGASEAMAAVIAMGFAAIARPRTTPSGAPACGNVATRAPRPVDCPPRVTAPILAATPTPAKPTTGGAQ